MMATFDAVEREMASILLYALEKHKDALAKVGIHVEVLDIRRSGDALQYYSEAGVYFWRGDDLVDALEYPIFRNGVLTASLSELDLWLNEAITDVVEQQRIRVDREGPSEA